MSAAYPTPVVAFPGARPRPTSAGTAETLVLVGLVLQIVGAAIVMLAIAWLFGFSIVHPFPYAWVAVTGAVAVGVLAVGFLYAAYELSYRRIQRGEYEAARAPTLVIGILSLIFGVLPGVFYLVAYASLGDATRELQQPPYGVPGPAPPWSASAPTYPAQVACAGCGRVYPAGPFAFCPGCGRKLGA